MWGTNWPCHSYASMAKKGNLENSLSVSGLSMYTIVPFIQGTKEMKEPLIEKQETELERFWET